MVKRSRSTKKTKQGGRPSMINDTPAGIAMVSACERPIFAFNQEGTAVDAGYLALVHQMVDQHRLRVFDIHNSAQISEFTAPNSGQDELKRFTCIAFGSIRPSSELKQAKRKKNSKGSGDSYHSGLKLQTVIALGLTDGTIALYSPAESKIIKRLSGGHTMPVRDVAFPGPGAEQEDQGLRCWSCDQGGNIVEWDLIRNAVVRQIKTTIKDISRIRIDSKAKKLAVASHKIEVIELGTSNIVAAFTGHGSDITELLWGPGGNSLVTAASNDRFVHIWPVCEADTTPRPASAVLSTDSNVLVVDVSPINGDVIAVTEDGTASIWAEAASTKSINKAISRKGGEGGRPAAQSPDSVVRLVDTKGASTIPIILSRLWRQSSQNYSALIVYGNMLKPVFETTLLADDKGELVQVLTLERDNQGGNLLLNGAVTKDVSQAEANLRSGLKTYDESRATVLSVADMTASGVSLAPTLEDRMRELGLVDSTQAASTDEGKPATASAPAAARGPAPKAGSLVRVLVQALHSHDQPMLESVLANGSRASIVNDTMCRLPANYVLQFLQELFLRFQATPQRAVELLPWIRAILVSHAGYLTSVPQLVKQLAAFYQAIDARLSVNSKLHRLQGRVDLLHQQIRARASAIKGDELIEDGSNNRALNLYVEGEEAGAMMDEELPIYDGESTTDASEVEHDWTDNTDDEVVEGGESGANNSDTDGSEEEEESDLEQFD